MTRTTDSEESASSEGLLEFLKSKETSNVVNNHPNLTIENSGGTRSRPIIKRRASSEPDDPWGWFEDFETSPMHFIHEVTNKGNYFHKQPLQRSLSLPGSVSTPPFYVLESSLATQQLWYITAGQRPKQPEKERRYYEDLWTQNFKNSSVDYNENAISDWKSSNDNLGQTMKGIDHIPKDEFDCEILFRGKGSFSNSVSKSFADTSMTQITIQVRFK
jgi:hypothetical protein